MTDEGKVIRLPTGRRVEEAVVMKLLFRGSEVVDGRVIVMLSVANADGRPSCPFCAIRLDVSDLSQAAVGRIVKNGLELRGQP